MTTVELDRPPRLPALYRRAVLGMLPGRRRGDGALPDTVLVLRQVPVDRSRLAGYVRVCGFPLTDTLPPTYPHLLAFPLALRLLTAPELPFPAVGMVHVANRIELYRPLAADQPLDLAVHVEGLRPHPRGRQLDVVVVAEVGGTRMWREVSTYLHRERQPAGREPEPGGREPVDRPAAVWRIGPEVGRAYAAVSGDRNPIHTSTLAARAFGFRGRIAHGMWTKARCLAQLGGRLPDAYAAEVAFKAPVVLPATVGFSATAGAADLKFRLHDTNSGKPHLSGVVSRLAIG
jgi:acyl dehydratase